MEQKVNILGKLGKGLSRDLFWKSVEILILFENVIFVYTVIPVENRFGGNELGERLINQPIYRVKLRR